MSDDFLAKVVIEGEDRSASAALKKTAGAAESAGASFKKLNEPIEGVRSAMGALGIGSNTAAGAMGQLAQGFTAVGGKAGLVGAGITAAAFAVNEFVQYSARVEAADKQFAALSGTFQVTREEVERASAAWANHGAELDRGGVQKLIAAGREAGLTTAEVTNLGAEADRIARTAGVSFEEGLVKALANAKENAHKAGDALQELLDKTERAERVGREGVLGVASSEAVEESKKRIDSIRAKLEELAAAREKAKAEGSREAMGSLVGLHAEELAATQALAEEEQRLAKIRTASTSAKGRDLDSEELAALAETIAEETEAHRKSVDLAKKAADEKAEINQALWDASVEKLKEQQRLEKEAEADRRKRMQEWWDEQMKMADARRKEEEMAKEAAARKMKELAREQKEVLRLQAEQTRKTVEQIQQAGQAAVNAIQMVKTLQDKKASTGQKIGSVLGTAGSIAMMIPGGQPAGAALMVGGSIASQFHAGGRVTAHSGRFLRGGRAGVVPVDALEGEGVVAREDMALLGGSRAPARIREFARGGGSAGVSIGSISVRVDGAAAPAHRDQAVRLLREAFRPALHGAISAEEKRLAALVGSRPSR